MRLGDGDYSFLAFRRKAANRYHSFDWFGPAGTTAVIVANRVYAAPIYVGKTARLASLAWNVTTLAVNSVGRAGIYENTPGDVYPSNLVVDTSNVNCNTTGLKEASIDIWLQKGKLYWLVFTANSNPTLRAPQAISQPAIWCGVNATLPTAYQRGWYVANAYGALPSTFIAKANASETSTLPGIYFKIKETW